MVPREHGAWSMLLVPFAGALLLARRWDVSLIPSTIAMLTVFLVREPLLVLARQRWVWRESRPESITALRWLAVESALIVLAGCWLLMLWPWWVVACFGGMAALLTALVVWLTINNRQRSIALQTASAAGLAASPLAVSLAVNRSIHEWAIWLWLLSTAHSTASILVVHARLETRIAARVPGKPAASLKPAWAAQGALLAGGLLCLISGRTMLAAALFVSASVHVWDLRTLQQATPLRTVGLRAMALSILFAAVVLSGLWRHS
jgi:hypothetical protein